MVLKSLRIPESEAWYTRFARHSWLDVRMQPAGAWVRLEIPTPRSGVSVKRIPDKDAMADRRWGRAVHVRKALIGPQAVEPAKRAVRLARDTRWPSYRGYPGPNSNTFVERMLHDLPELGATMDANAVGKDFGAKLGISETAAGVELDAWVLGLQVGWREGVELHLLGLTLG